MESACVRRPWARCYQQCSTGQRSTNMGRYNAHVCLGGILGRLEVPTADQVRHISSSRHPIPDVPVLYLVEPTASNLTSITSDLSRGLYSPAYINFLSSIPRPLLEDFARQTAETNTSESIAQFYDQYLNFIVGEPDLFSLGMRKENTYWALNSAKTRDEELDNVIDKTVSGLFSVMATMGMAILGAIWTSTDLFRRHADHTLSQRRRGRNDISKARSEATRPYPQLERQFVFVAEQSTFDVLKHFLLATCTGHPRSKCGFDPHALAFLDIPITRPRRSEHEAQQDYGGVTCR